MKRALSWPSDEPRTHNCVGSPHRENGANNGESIHYVRSIRKGAMAFMVKHMIGGQLKDLTGGIAEEKPEGEKSEAAAKGMTQEEFEQYQEQLAEEKQERDDSFAQKKAERATIRTHFREKYRLPKSELDATQIQAAGDDVALPTELAKMIAEDNQEEEQKQSVLGQLTSLQNMDLDQLKDKAQATVDDLKKTADKCEVM
ncbi:complexin-3a isoform X1 [Sardina pilchardus]|uniref:complexin-3a isoform X1 n=2 Tax=Sardina pilchardus TaxID=27697 RepID=UPI002E134B5A